MTQRARTVQMPVLSMAIVALWVALTGSLDPGNLLLALLLGLALPRLTRAFWPDPPHVMRPLVGIRLALTVIMDIVLANLTVARQVLGPTDRLAPAFVEIPLDIDDPFVASILGSVISLTPGTVTMEIDRQRRILIAHALDVRDEAMLVATIKARYEAPLKEIFRC